MTRCAPENCPQAERCARTQGEGVAVDYSAGRNGRPCLWFIDTRWREVTNVKVPDPA